MIDSAKDLAKKGIYCNCPTAGIREIPFKETNLILI
jgi:hypothetical protein